MGTSPKIAENGDNLSTIAQALALPKTREPEDVSSAKDLIAKYVGEFAIPASSAVQEAVRKSAYVLKDTAPESPLSHFAWVGVLDGGNPKTKEWQGLADPDVYRNVPTTGAPTTLSPRLPARGTRLTLDGPLMERARTPTIPA